MHMAISVEVTASTRTNIPETDRADLTDPVRPPIIQLHDLISRAWLLMIGSRCCDAGSS
jgi:hypothetical protein